MNSSLKNFAAADYVAIFAVLICFAVTVIVAVVSNIKTHARLFTSLVFLALAWGVIYPYYLSIPGCTEITLERHLLPALQGILLAFSGGPLRREAVARKKGTQDPGVEPIDLWIMSGLFTLIIVLPPIAVLQLLPGLVKRDYVIIFLAQLFSIIGYISVGLGLYQLTRSESTPKRQDLLFGAAAIMFAVGYAAVQMYWSAYLWHHAAENPCMPPLLKYTFSGVKILFTAIFLTVAILKARSQPFVSVLEEREAMSKSSSNDGKASKTLQLAERAMEKKHVFVSYCHDNSDEVARLREELIKAGEAVWWDQDIKPGQDWKFEIRQAMKDAYAVVLCLSKETEGRGTSGIYPEALDAINAYREYAPGKIFLIPIRLSACEIPPIELDGTRTLDRLQYADLFPSANRAASVKNLLMAIQAATHHP